VGFIYKEEAVMRLNRILVPLDGSALAESALEKAVEMAGGWPCTLMLLRATEAHTLPGMDPIEAQVHVVREAEDYLAAVAARLKAQGIKNVETSVWYEPAASAIVDAAHLRKADLIVMSTHGRSGLGRLILGSVAESVLRGTTTPILLLRAPEAPVEMPRGAKQARPTKETAHV
jgi:nucleotide-binding universal stress UspA family protein